MYCLGGGCENIVNTSCTCLQWTRPLSPLLPGALPACPRPAFARVLHALGRPEPCCFPLLCTSHLQEPKGQAPEMGRGWWQVPHAAPGASPCPQGIFLGVPWPRCWELHGQGGFPWALSWCCWVGMWPLPWPLCLLSARKEKGKKRRGGKKRWWLPVQPWGLRNAITGKLDLLEGPGVSEGGFYCPDTSGRRWVG